LFINKVAFDGMKNISDFANDQIKWKCRPNFTYSMSAGANKYDEKFRATDSNQDDI
jgi:hypothetical protein